MAQRVFLEEADRPPPSYYQHNEDKNTSCKDPIEWAKAPEFIPRRRQLEAAFSLDEPTSSFPSHDMVPPPFIPQMMERRIPPFVQGQLQFFNGMPLPPLNLPFPPSTPLNPSSLPFLPQGYSANITNINAGLGPPIPAIVLKKKRRKRHKHSTQSLIVPEEAILEFDKKEEDTISEEAEGINCMRGKSDETVTSTTVSRDTSLIRGGSCPDLSEDQLRVWENLLYERVMEEKDPPPPAPRNASEAMRTSTYDMLPRALREVAEEHLDGFSSREIRKLDQEINGNIMTDSIIVTRLQEANNINANHIYNDACLSKPLSAEMNELSFRPQMTKYGYPQYNDEKAHLTTFHHSTGTTSNRIINPRDLLSDEDDDRFIEDSIEGFNIRVNAFDEVDDVALSESDLPPPSRFEQIHWALQTKAAAYRERNDIPLRPPDRVCCTLM